MPEPGPLSRLTASPRALAGLAGALLVAAIVVVVVLVGGGGGSSSSPPMSTVTVKPLKAATLPPVNPHRDNLQTIFTEGSAIFSDPTQQIAQIAALGANRVRVSFTWSQIAPHATSRRAPRFDAADPADYPAGNWKAYDTIDRLIHKYHLSLDAVLAPPPPLWASGSGAPAPANTHPYWKPNPAMFEKFVEAVGTRYSGHYTPKGASSPLPRIDFWSVWNEPNLGVMLAPETLNGPTVEFAPSRYRELADAAWTALHQTGHGSDTTLIGELAPVGNYGDGKPGDFAVMAPLRFLRVMYCLTPTFQRYTGHQAAIRGCPATAAAQKRFVADNPVLFHASAFAVHPYPQALPPNVAIPVQGQDDAILGQIEDLFATLDRTQKAYGSSRRLDVYSTEFGYITDPPNKQGGGVTPTKASRWLNWSEYISWRLPRLLSYDQYLLVDPPPVPGKAYARFASGLFTYKYLRKPTFYAFQMPIWLPQTAESKGGSLEVWGCVRPAKLVSMAKRAPAQIQFRPKTGGHWKTLATASTRTQYGYFDLHVKFPGAGAVRIRWQPATGPAITSRVQPIIVS